jgi:hypothetical protein
MAISDIRDTLGNNLHVEETAGGHGTCEGLQRDIFRFERIGNNYESQFCITSPRPNEFPDLRVRMQLTGAPGTIDMLGNRVLAIASCLPTSGTNVLNAGVTVGRQVVRTSTNN